MKIILIAVLNKKRVIARNGRIPWRISEDLQRFKLLTTGSVLVMGRKTFESIGKPLSYRRNIVITSKEIPGTETFPSLASALDALRAEEKIFVIGGGTIFHEAIDAADELLLTEMEDDTDGDVFFPEYEDAFRLTNEEKHEGFSFRDYVKIRRTM